MKIILLLSLIPFCAVMSQGQSWKLTETMTATLKNDTMTISTTQSAEAMPDYNWETLPPWFEVRGGIHSVVIEDKVTSVGTWAFMHCAGITSITLSNSVESINGWGFYNCYNLPSIEIPEGVTTIDFAAFGICESLSEVEIPASVSSINSGAFRQCIRLTYLNVNEDNAVYSSNDGILYNKDYTSLIIYPENKSDESFTIPNTVTSIERSAFYNAQFSSITIPNSVTTIGLEPFERCKRLTTILVDEDNADFSSCDGVLFDKKQTALLSYPEGKEDTEYVIPNTVREIVPCAFSIAKLLSVTIPISVTTLANNAFQYCEALEKVTVEWDDPLAVSAELFHYVDLSTITLYVPTGRTAYYEAADVWKDFGTIIEYTFSGNEQIMRPVSVWSQNGRLHIAGLMPGKPLSIYNLAGQVLYHGIVSMDVVQIPFIWRGICVIVSGGQSLKVYVE